MSQETPNEAGTATAMPMMKDEMSTPNEAKVFEYDKYRQDLVQSDSELKMFIEKVLDLRVQAVELEASLTSFYCPILQAKLRLCQELAAKCEEHRRTYQTVEDAAPLEKITWTTVDTAPADKTVGNATDVKMEVDLTTPLPSGKSGLKEEDIGSCI